MFVTLLTHKSVVNINPSLTGQGEKSGLLSYPDGRLVGLIYIYRYKLSSPAKQKWQLNFADRTLPKLDRQVQRVLKKLENVYPTDKYEIFLTFDHSITHTKLTVDRACPIDGSQPGRPEGRQSEINNMVK